MKNWKTGKVYRRNFQLINICMYIYITIYFPQNWGRPKTKKKNKYWVYQFRMMELKIVKYQKEEQ